MSHLLYLMGLSRISCLGPRRIASLIEKFSSTERAWKASREELSGVKGLGPKMVEEICRERNNIDLSLIWQETVDKDIRVIPWDDYKYPLPLKNIHSPPVLLYVKGQVDFNGLQGIGMVGTRKSTPYGKRITRTLAYSLATCGFTVISGMARGIDTIAHHAALEAGGRTLAVLGSGVDVVYPRENYSLAQEIIRKGALISEFPPGARPSAQNFPRRNRIISGLSEGLIVVEAAERSGALITADFALEQGKEVFAVPGNVDSPYSKGCHKLIKEGAVLVQDPLDVLLELGYNGTKTRRIGESRSFTLEEVDLLKVVTEQPIHIDEILKLCSLPPSRLNSLLTTLEVKGAIKQQTGKYFVKIIGEV